MPRIKPCLSLLQVIDEKWQISELSLSSCKRHVLICNLSNMAARSLASKAYSGMAQWKVSSGSTAVKKHYTSYYCQNYLSLSGLGTLNTWLSCQIGNPLLICPRTLTVNPTDIGSREHSFAQNQPPKIILFEAPAVFGQLVVRISWKPWQD